MKCIHVYGMYEIRIMMAVFLLNRVFKYVLCAFLLHSRIQVKLASSAQEVTCVVLHTLPVPF